MAFNKIWISLLWLVILPTHVRAPGCFGVGGQDHLCDPTHPGAKAGHLWHLGGQDHLSDPAHPCAEVRIKRLGGATHIS